MSNCAVSHNTFILAKFIEFFPTKFHAIVSSQALDLFSSLLLNHSFPLLELPKYIILMLQDIYSDLSRVIINKGQHISSTTMWYNLRRAPKIQMDLIQNTFISINAYIEFHPALFPEHTMLTKIQFSYFCPSRKPRLLKIVNYLSLICPSRICHNLVVSIIDFEVETATPTAPVTVLPCNV